MIWRYAVDIHTHGRIKDVQPRICVWTDIYIYICVRIYMYACTCLYICTYIHICMYMSIYMYNIYTDGERTAIHACIYLCIYIYTCIYIYLYVYRYMLARVDGNRCVYCSKASACAFVCSILQHTATYCNALYHTATDCNILQHTPAELRMCMSVYTHRGRADASECLDCSRASQRSGPWTI